MPFIPDSELKKQTGFVPPKKEDGLFTRLSKATGEVGTGIKNTWDSVTERIKNIGSIGGRLSNQSPPETILQLAGEVAGGAGDIIGEGLSTAVGVSRKIGLTPEEDINLSKTIGAVGQDIAKTKAAQVGLELIKKYQELEKTNPRLTNNINAVANLGDFALNFIGGSVSTKGGEKVLAGITKGVEKGAETAIDIAKTVAKPLAGAVEATKPIIKAGSEVVAEGAQAVGRGTEKAKEFVAKKAAQASLPEAEKEIARVLPEDVISTVKSASPETKKSFTQMIEKADKNLTNPMERPIEIAGQKLVDNAVTVSKKLKTVGKELGNIKQTLKGKEVTMYFGANPEGKIGIGDEIIKDLEKYGIELTDKGLEAGKDVPINDDVLEVLNDVYRYAGSKPTVKAENADRLRSVLFKTHSKSGVPLQDEAQSLVTKYRDMLKDSIGSVSPEYAKTMAKYSDLHEVLEDFTKLLGYKGNMEALSKKALRAGEVANRVLGNASDRPREVIDALIKAVGGTDEVYKLIQFADTLEGLLGTTPARSLGGQVERAGGNIVSKIPGIGEAVGGLLQAGAPDAKAKLEALFKLVHPKAQ